MKKRHRQLAGKALKDVKNLTTCPGCGEIKRAHVLCPNCVGGMYFDAHEWTRLDSDGLLLYRYKEAMEGAKAGVICTREDRI